MFLSFPPPTKMFQFRGLAHLTMCQVFYLTGCPIQKSSDQVLFANPRSFSQLTTSFFASKSQGILRTPLLTFFFVSHYPARYRSIVRPPFSSLNLSKNFSALKRIDSIAVSLRYRLACGHKRILL